MTDIIIWWVGLVGVMALLAFLTWLAGTACYVLSERACKQILRYRRLAYLRYWTNRLENAGLLPIDQHYRDISKGQPPKDVAEAMEWDRQWSIRPDGATQPPAAPGGPHAG